MREILPSYRVSATLGRWLVAGWADWAFKMLLYAFSGRIALSRHGSASAGLSWVSRSTGMADQPALRRLPVTAATSGADESRLPASWLPGGNRQDVGAGKEKAPARLAARLSDLCFLWANEARAFRIILISKRMSSH